MGEYHQMNEEISHAVFLYNNGYYLCNSAEGIIQTKACELLPQVYSLTPSRI